MRKSYIGWWAASALLFFGCIRSVYEMMFFPEPNAAAFGGFGFVFLLACLFLFIGYRRWVEYREYQEDRKIRNEYYQSNTNEEKLREKQRIIEAGPGMIVMTSETKRKEAELAAHRLKLEEAQKAKEEEKAVRAKKREGTVKREFSVAGVSMHQDVFKRAGYRNEAYSLSAKRIEEEGLEDENIPQYFFDTIDVSLELDPENEQDPNAVRVLLNNDLIGYIPADDAEYVHDMIEDDRVADIDARIVGGPFKRLDSGSDEIEKVDLSFGMRLDLFIRQGR